MAVLHFPSGDQRFYDLIRHFRPVGSTTTVWAPGHGDRPARPYASVGRRNLLARLRWYETRHRPFTMAIVFYRAYPA